MAIIYYIRVHNITLDFLPLFTPGGRQLKTLLTIEECGSKMARNNVFDSHLSPDWQSQFLFLTIFDLHSMII